LRHKGNIEELRLFLENICCDLCRFNHEVEDGIAREDIRVDREVYLGAPGAFADIRVSALDHPPYFVELKFGYSTDVIVHHMKRKYAAESRATEGASKVILVVDAHNHEDWPSAEARIGSSLRPGLALEVWDEKALLSNLHKRFGVEVKSLSEENLLDLQAAIDRARGFQAFGGEALETYEHDELKATLLWHFGSRCLRRLRETRHLSPEQILLPGTYRNCVVLLADLCSFSSYVRDTRDPVIVRDALTSFYSRTRFQIINNGGMVYQFVGDQVIAFFGIPDQLPHYEESALDTAKALVDIGNSVSNEWQRRIDHIQSSQGVHIGISVGDVEIVRLRPFSRTHLSAVSDTINLASRLTQAAGQSEIVISNSFFQRLDYEHRAQFREIDMVEARNLGKIKAWKRDLNPS